MTCARCGRPMVRRGRSGRQHIGRGLCIYCYDTVRRSGCLSDYERPTRTADEVLDDWVLLRSDGCTVPQAATRMGMRPEALFKALERARRRGDARAAFTWAGQTTSRARRKAS